MEIYGSGLNLAKHCAPGKDNIIPKSPGYARINDWCGAMDYQLLAIGLVTGHRHQHFRSIQYREQFLQVGSVILHE